MIPSSVFGIAMVKDMKYIQLRIRRFPFVSTFLCHRNELFVIYRPLWPMVLSTVSMAAGIEDDIATSTDIMADCSR